MLKNWQGWTALAIFAASSYIIGVNRYLMKYMNATVLVMLAISIGLVLLLNSKKPKGEEETVELEDEV